MAPPPPIHPVYFKQIGIKDGLSQISVMSIYQDELGRMWFGTEEGLSIYDGKEIVTYKHSEDSVMARTIPIGNRTFPITGDKNGNVYFRSDDKFIRYDVRKERFTCLKSGNISTVFCRDGGAVLVASTDTVYRWDETTQTFHYITDVRIPHVFIYKLFVDSDSRLWIGTRNGLFRQNEAGRPDCILPDEDIFEIVEDSQSNLWIATRNAGMYIRNRQGEMKRIKHIPGQPNGIPHNQIRSFTEDNYGNMWIGTFAGLCKYTPSTGVYTVYRKDNQANTLQHSSVFSTCRDRQGTLWVGTYYGGVHYFNPETDCFSHYSADITRSDCLSHFFVGRMEEDKNRNLWICTEGGGLNFFDRKTKRFRHFMSDESRSSIAHNNLKCIRYSAKHDKLYIGTHTGGLTIYDMRRHTFRNFRDEKPEFHRMTGDIITQLEFYKEDTLIIYAQKGYFKLNLVTEQLTPLFERDTRPYASRFYIDSGDHIWLSNSSSLIKMNLHNLREATRYDRTKTGFGSFSISCIFEDFKGRLFFGTAGSGLYRYLPETESFTAYTAENNMLQSNYCYDIAQSEQNELIVSGDRGLSFLDVDNRRLRVIHLNALTLSGINSGCGLFVCRNGEIFAGGINGLTSFFEQEVFGINKSYDLYFSSLSVNAERILPDDKTKILRQALPFTEKITLKHTQNNFSLSFTSNNYIKTSTEDLFEYKLEGFDSRWIVGDKIIYTNITPGRYRLTVRERIASPGRTTPKSLSMDIVVRHAWYASPYACTLYFIIAYLLLFSFIRFHRVRRHLKISLEAERKDKERIEDLNRAKLQFFSNISHEFHTPLTLIIVQIERLLNNNIPPFIHHRLLKINRNAGYLQNLVSELLDFRKLEQGHITLKVREQNLIPFLKEIYLAFLELSAERNISYRFETGGMEEILCWYDPKQMRKVFFNLLSNAFKYTRPNDSIDISVKDETDAVTIKVIDSGIGIEKDDIDKIFNHFYQADSPKQSAVKSPGAGIGLAVVKGVLELHHGSIAVESKPSYGSIFVVSLRKGCSHFGRDEFAEPADLRNEFLKNNPPITPPGYLTATGGVAPPDESGTEAFASADPDKRSTVLIVEDNDELLQILHDILRPLYNIRSAHNGAEGLRSARRHKPDLIISDIIMPEMSGTEMCMAVKSDFETCHIPVILLTALSSTEHNIYGLQHGADDYVGKPFNEKALIARCNNLIKNRMIIKNKFSRNVDFDAQSISNNPIDQKFLDTINRIIEKNFDNPSFNINILAKELTLSRSSLYTKFEALTGMTPNDYVLQRKLKKAADLLKNNTVLNVTEISDRLGFGSPRYFSRCFKKQFTQSPAEYRKRVTTSSRR
jgi:signal transduction histidine kinase/ligand-binding sensor domain-containing protein/DNA-binding response OmpR family regulator